MTDQPGSSTDQLDRDVRVFVYSHAAETTRVPLPGEIAAALGREIGEVEDAIRRLAASRVWFLAPGTANIWAANPFCAVPSNFRVNALDRTYWGVCVWDAMGIAAALHANATITAQCGDCNEHLFLEIRDGDLANSEGIVHFAVPAMQWWQNIAFT